MSKIVKSLAIILCISILVIPGIGCAKKTTAPAAATEVATVGVGNLIVSTSVDGNLVMPQAYNLLFGAPGSVQEVFVREGDVVKEGAILATLDNTVQRLSVESANNNVQVVLSKLYENVPLLPQFRSAGLKYVDISPPPHLPPVYVEEEIKETLLGVPFYYANATLLSAYNWAKDEVKNANKLCQSDNYTAAASELYVALSDLEACMQILNDTMNNPDSGLGNIAPLVPTDEAGITQLEMQMDQSWAVNYVVELRKAIDLIKKGQADTDSVRGLINQGKYDEARQMFPALLKQVSDIAGVVYSNINVIKSHSTPEIYGRDISLYFYGAAADKLSAALKGIETGALNAPDLYDNLRIADHYMRICNSILGSNDYVLQHGLSLKNEQQYHVDLQNALTGLGNAQQDFLKTVILAPFDGTVVNVGVKKNDVLSQIDYASTTAVQLVDTTQIKFQGQVDEIDILQIKTGQKATIEVDAVPYKVFTGTVSFISPFGTPDSNGVVQFPVTIQLDPTDVALKGGLTATADIGITSVENALLVPLTAVNPTPSGATVTVIDRSTGKQETRQVTLGEKNLQFAQVLSGLNDGDEVVIVESATKAPVVKGFPRQSVTPGR